MSLEKNFIVHHQTEEPYLELEVEEIFSGTKLVHILIAIPDPTNCLRIRVTLFDDQ